jgi:tetratricopeptide (TPR) repeat protein
MRLRDRHLFIISVAIVLGISACTPAQTLPASPNNQTVKPVSLQSKPIVEFRIQKPGTETQFAAKNQVLQQLLAEQKEIEKKGDRNAIKKNQTNIERINKEISSLFEPAKLDDRDITQASVEQNDAGTNVLITFTEEGAKKFAEVTKNIAGTGRYLGIFYQGKLVSFPAVDTQFAQTGITGGQASIGGNFTAKEANDIVVKLNKNALSSPAGQAESLVIEGTNKLKQKNFTEAINYFDEAIKLDPKNIRAYLARGQGKTGLKKWQEAIKDYQQALEIDSNNTDAYIGMARAKEGLKDYTGAIADYEKVQKIDPNNSNGNNIYSALLKNYILAGKKQEALNQSEKVLENSFRKDEEKSDEAKFLRHFIRAATLIYFKDYKTAISDFDRAIAIQSQYSASYLYRGVAYEKSGDRQAAIKDYQKVISIKLQDAIFRRPTQDNIPISEIELRQAYLFRGVAYSKLEDWKNAKQDLDKAIAIDSNDANAYQQRSLVRQKLKDEAGAKQDADKATELFELSGEIALPF